ncbi:MAG: CBS domain-containing protein [Actinomycetota bacterium]
MKTLEDRRVEAELGRVCEYMTRDVIEISATDSLAHAVRKLKSADVSGAPVVAEDGHVVGVVTLTDLFSIMKHPTVTADTGPFLRRENTLGELAVRMGLRVRDVMSRDPVTVDAYAPLVTAAHLMVSHGVNRLPVVDENGRVHGIITRDDLVEAVARAAQG